MIYPRRHRYRRPPHWWPEGEQWPPLDRSMRWRRRRYRFMRVVWVWMVALWLIAAGLWRANRERLVGDGG